MGNQGTTDVAVHIPVDKIHPDPSQPRKHFDETYIAGLAQSIGVEGQDTPIRVRPHPDQATYPGEYRLIYGECRYWAIKKHGAKYGVSTLKAFVDDKLTDPKEIFKRQMMENMVRKNMRPFEDADACYYAVNALGMSVDELSRSLGKSANTIKADIHMAEGIKHDVIRKAVDNGDLPKAVAREIAGLSMEYQLKAWDKAKAGKNVAQMVANVEKYRSQVEQGDGLVIGKTIGELATDPEYRQAGKDYESFAKKLTEFAGKYGNGGAFKIAVARKKVIGEVLSLATTMQSVGKALATEATKVRADLDANKPLRKAA